MISQELFADACYKEAVRRFRERHEFQMHTIQDMTPVMRMDRAHKFNLSREIAQAAQQSFYSLFDQSNKSDFSAFLRVLDVTVPPFEHTWIDMPMTIRSETEHRIKDDMLIGFLIHRALKSFVVDICIAAQDDHFGSSAGPLPISFLIASNPKWLPNVDPGTWREFSFSLSDEKEGVVLPRVWHRFRSWSGISSVSMYKYLSVFLSLIVGSLALINVAPTIKETYRPRGSSIVRGKIKPYFSKTKITLELPHRRVVSIMRSVATGRSSPRRHSVRGHFRHYVGKNGELLRRTWVRDHHRGDGTIGWVRQDHEVVAKNRKIQINPLVFEEPRET